MTNNTFMVFYYLKRLPIPDIINPIKAMARKANIEVIKTLPIIPQKLFALNISLPPLPTNTC